MAKFTDKDIELVAMQIIHHAGERFDVGVRTRQAFNDELIDYAISKINNLLTDGGGSVQLVRPHRPEGSES